MVKERDKECLNIPSCSKCNSNHGHIVSNIFKQNLNGMIENTFYCSNCDNVTTKTYYCTYTRKHMDQNYNKPPENYTRPDKPLPPPPKPNPGKNITINIVINNK